MYTHMTKGGNPTAYNCDGKERQDLTVLALKVMKLASKRAK